MGHWRMLSIFSFSILTLMPIIPGKTIPLLTTDESESDEATSDDECATEACSFEADWILKFMDRNVDPCDDFHNFACGRALKTIDPPYSLYMVRRRAVNDNLKVTLQEESNENEILPFQMVKQFYKDCLKADFLNDNARETILNKMNSLGGWPWIDDWVLLLEKSREIGFRSDYILSLSIDSDNSIHVTIPDQDYLETCKFLDPLDHNSQLYLDLVHNFGLRNQTSSAKVKKELEEMINFEKKLKNTTTSTRTNSTVTLTVEAAQNLFPSIEWLRIINAILGSNLSIDQNEIILIDSVEWIRKLQELLDTTPKKVIMNYIIWRNIEQSLQYYFINNNENREGNCLGILKEHFSPALSAMYIRLLINNRIIKNGLLGMFETVREAQKDIISASNWINNETRQAALEKAQSITGRVGYPDELFNDTVLNRIYENLHLETNQYYDNILKLARIKMDQHFLVWREFVNKTDILSYSLKSFETNFYYVRYENTIDIPASMLGHPFYRIDRPNYMNYGFMGSSIGHEFSHAFDNESHIYDNDYHKKGWNAEMENKYNERAECFINQYNQFVIKETGETVNGTRTLDENIADNEGIRTAYLAYKTWKNKHDPEKKLPGLDYTYEQMFWISAATAECSKYTFKYMIGELREKEHAVYSARASIPFANQNAFATDFNCPVGSRMNPSKKCTLW